MQVDSVSGQEFIVAGGNTSLQSEEKLSGESCRSTAYSCVRIENLRPFCLQLFPYGLTTGPENFPKGGHRQVEKNISA